MPEAVQLHYRSAAACLRLERTATFPVVETLPADCSSDQKTWLHHWVERKIKEEWAIDEEGTERTCRHSVFLFSALWPEER
jgi:hypothetical protein